jgi:GNAT superfamily N-acetyltransferase
MTITYAVRPLDDEIAAAYGRLLPEQRDLVARGKLAWKFEQSPAGRGVLALALLDGAIVGINGFAPATLRRRGMTGPGFQSLDTVVDPACRGQGVFTGLVNAFYEAAPTLGATVLYGIPNENSAGGFFGKLGWTRLAPPPYMIKPLNAGYFASRLLGEHGRVLDPLPLSLTRTPRGAEKAVRITRFDDSADALWAAFSAEISCAVDRGCAMLNWRLFDCPAAEYETWGVLDADGGLRAFVSTHVSDKHGGRIGYIMEAMAHPDAEADLTMLLRRAVHAMRLDRIDAVLAWSGKQAPNHRAHRRTGFLPMPEWSRPIHLAFGARVLDEDTALGRANLGGWYLSYLDSDTV